MQTISTAANGGLMAQWLATGGALEAPTGEAAGTAGDDGLAATTTQPPVCHWVDEGLSASPQTLFLPCNGDDGLAANRVTSPAGGCPPFADDGLLAGNVSRPPQCWGVAMIEDDGLSASNVSPTYPGFCWDRR